MRPPAALLGRAHGWVIHRWVVGGALALLTSALVVACGDGTADNPFVFDPGIGGAGGQGEGGEGGGTPTTDPTLGGPCTAAAQCDDGHDCTFDTCDLSVLRCRFVPDDSACQNGISCDGMEVCDNTLGCIAGEPVTCSDGSACNINTCVEETGQCLSEPRDVDGDGDPDDHCGGGDCDDTDPFVASTAPELCGNDKDDDCDGDTDEADCATPQYDTCFDPIEMATPGSYALDTTAAVLDYSASCGVEDAAQARDVVAAVLLPAGDPVDVQVTARTTSADVAVSILGQCGDAGTEISCSGGFDHPDGGRVAKTRARGVGDAGMATAYPAVVFTDAGAAVTLELEILPAEAAPTHETCATALPITPSQPEVAKLVGVAQNLVSACEPATGELVYTFDLAAPANIDIFGTSLDGDGDPVLSLRNASCALEEDEITCNEGATAHIFRHGLPAGTYTLAVAATAPTDVAVTVELSAATAPPADEDCATAPPLAANTTIDVDFADHQDDIAVGCQAGATDAAYALTLSEASDVLVLGRISDDDVASVALMAPPCDALGDTIACRSGQQSPIRATEHDVPPGSYRVVAESQEGSPMQVTALVRPAVPTTLVPFADGCADVVAIPATGGFFQGNTNNAQADFNAGCDAGGQPQGGAREQLLELTLSAPKRVVLDMQGSAYATLLNVRQGPACPGDEMTASCAAGFVTGRSFLDLDLPAGVYYLQIDGYAQSSGPWFLDVFVVDP